MINLEINGLDSLIKKLNYLGADGNSLVMKGLLIGAEKIKQDARNLSPKDTGHLRQSIGVEKITNGYQVGTNVNYAICVEYGTGTRGDPSVPHTARTSWRYQDAEGRWHTCYGMRPIPFMRNSFGRNKSYVIKAVRAELVKELGRRTGTIGGT